MCASRYVSLASLAAVLALCIARLLTPEPFAAHNRILTLFCLLAGALVVARHRANIVRLLHGNENRLGDSGTMLTFTKVVHVLAMGLWFGTAVFFLFVAVSLFHSLADAAERFKGGDDWFPLGEHYRLDPKEQGLRAAAAVISPLFNQYFAMQTVCGCLAVATALGWQGSGARVHKWRRVVLVVALLTVLGGWALEGKVQSLRSFRNAVVDSYLQEGVSPSSSAFEQALREGRVRPLA